MNYYYLARKYSPNQNPNSNIRNGNAFLNAFKKQKHM